MLRLRTLLFTIITLYLVSNLNATPKRFQRSTQRCREDVLFIAKKLGEAENLDFLDESISVNTIQECAEKCFDICCHVAVYLDFEKKCLFTRQKSISEDTNSCETKPLKFYVNQYNGADRVKITCVTCGLASKIVEPRPFSGHFLVPEAVVGFQSSSDQQQLAIASMIDASSIPQDKDWTIRSSHPNLDIMERACIIMFEVDPNVEITAFQSSDYVEANGVNHCAYMCYRDACTAAVFKPAATTNKKGICERKFDGMEKCNATLRRDYYYHKTTEPVYLQCFRCLPRKPPTKPSVVVTTTKTDPLLVTEKQKLTLNDTAHAVDGNVAASKMIKMYKNELETSMLRSTDSKLTIENMKTNEGEGVDQKEGENTQVVKNRRKLEKLSDGIVTNDEGLAPTVEETGKQGIEVSDAELTSVPDIEEMLDKTPETKYKVTVGESNSETGLKSSLLHNATLTSADGSTPKALSGAEEFTVDEVTTFEGIFGTVENAHPSSYKTVGAVSMPVISSEVGSTRRYDSSFIVVSKTKSTEPMSPPFGAEEYHSSITISTGKKKSSTDEYNRSVQKNKIGAVEEIMTTTDTINKQQMEAESSDYSSTPRNGVRETITIGTTAPTALRSTELEAKFYDDSVVSLPNTIPPLPAQTLSEVESLPSNIQHAAIIESEVVQKSVDEKMFRKAKKDEEGGVVFSQEPFLSQAGSMTKVTMPKTEEQNEVSASTILPFTNDNTGMSIDTEIEKLPNEAAAKNATKQHHKFPQGCIVIFQAYPYSRRPKESFAGFQASTIAQTSEVCAGRCYQDGCTGARYNPSTKECILGYSGGQICNEGPKYFFYNANETIWIQCTGCRLHRPGDEGVNILIKPSKAEVAKKAIKTAEGAVAVATVSPSATQFAKTETIGMTSSKTESGTTVDVASETEENKFSKTTNRRWEETLQATTLDQRPQSTDEWTTITTTMASKWTTLEAEGNSQPRMIVVTEPLTLSGKATVEEEKAEESLSPAAATITMVPKPSLEAVEASTVIPTISTTTEILVGTTITGTVIEKTEASIEELNIDAIPKTIAVQKEEMVVEKEKLSFTTPSFDTALPGLRCIVSFQTRPITTNLSTFISEFVTKKMVVSAKECAKLCYMEGCTGAKFDPVNRDCSLTFDDHQQCDGNEDKYEKNHSVEATETLWIHCISCKQELTERNVDFLLGDTTFPKAITESWKAESLTGTAGNMLSSKQAEAEEKFLSTVNQDAVLESTHDTASKVTVQAGDESVDGTLETTKHSVFSGTLTTSETISSKAETTQSTAESGQHLSGASENKNENLTAIGEIQFVTVVLEEQANTSQLASQSVESEDVSVSEEHLDSTESTTKGTVDPDLSYDLIAKSGEVAVNETIVTKKVLNTVKEVGKIINDQSETTIQPEALISLTAQTPLSVPLDTSEILGTTLKMDGTSAAVSEIEKLTTELPLRKFEVIDRTDKNNVSSTTADHKKDEVTLTLVKVTIMPVVRNDTTTLSEAVAFQKQVENKAVEDITDNVAIGTEIFHGEATVPERMTAKFDTDTTLPSLLEHTIAETTKIQSRAGKTSSSSMEASLINPNVAIAYSSTPEVSFAEMLEKATTSEVQNAISVESNKQIVSKSWKESTVTGNKDHILETFGTLETVSTDEFNAGGTMFSGLPEDVTEQPVVQESVDDDNIRDFVQSTPENSLALMGEIFETVDEEKAITRTEESKLEKTVIKAITNSFKMAGSDLSTKEVRHSLEELIQYTDEHTTTEPPVQAVSDLVDILSKNSKFEEVLGQISTRHGNEEKDKESFTSTNDAFVVKEKHEERPFDVAVTQDSRGTSIQRDIKRKLFQGATVKCSGRIQFEVSSIGDLPGLNVTNEVAVKSPADCARRCYEAAECGLAGFVPKESDHSLSNAMCLLTSNDSICSSDEKSVSHHPSDTMLIISCLKCSKCDYTISAATKTNRICQVESIEPALSIEHCAETCLKHNCTVAQYDHKSNLCSLSRAKRQERCKEDEAIAVHSDDALLLEGVQCSA